MKAIGYALLGLGFLAGAFFVVRIERDVEWFHYGISAAVMLAGLVFVRMGAGEADEEAVHGEGVRVLARSLEALVGKLEALNGAGESMDVYAVRERIDAELMEDLDAFVQARESMIPRYGMQTYANVMSAFAASERLINRGWSASADGYIDEVWASLARAEAEMRDARERLAAAQAV